MSKKEEVKSNDLIVKGPNGDFDLSNPNGVKQVEEVLWSLARAQGKAAQEMDQMKKSQSRKYDLVSSDLDLKDAKAQAKQLREQGASEEDVDNFWGEYNVQSVKAASKSNQFDVMWADYRAYRPELFQTLSQLDQDLYKKHVQDSYKERLQGEENQFQFLDQVFEAKIRSASPVDSDESNVPAEPAPYVEGGSRSSQSQLRPKAQVDETDEDRASVIETYKKMGFEIK